MLTDDEFYDIWKSDVINSLQLIYKKGYDDAKQELKREPLSELEIQDALIRCRQSTTWDYGFEAGVKYAEKMYGIGVGNE